MDENQRAAASMKVGISNYVGSAALAVLAVAAGLFTYISQMFQPPFSFYLLMVLAAGCLVFSLILGGGGADEVTGKVAPGTWSNQSTSQFNLQSIMTLLGLVLLLAATAVGATARTQASVSQQQLTTLSQTTGKLQRSLEVLTTSQAAQAARLHRVER